MPKRIPKAPSMRKFVAYFQVEIEIDQRLLDAVLTDDWRAQFYNFHTPEQVASWLAFNYARGCKTSNIDGVADQPESYVNCGELDGYDCELDGYDCYEVQ